jgi:hypothetical protein
VTKKKTTKNRKLCTAHIDRVSAHVTSVLKYSRLTGKLPEILAKDSASAVDVSPRVLVSCPIKLGALV